MKMAKVPKTQNAKNPPINNMKRPLPNILGILQSGFDWNKAYRRLPESETLAGKVYAKKEILSGRGRSLLLFLLSGQADFNNISLLLFDLRLQRRILTINNHSSGLYSLGLLDNGRLDYFAHMSFGYDFGS